MDLIVLIAAKKLAVISTIIECTAKILMLSYKYLLRHSPNQLTKIQEIILVNPVGLLKVFAKVFTIFLVCKKNIR
jgi:hypothetical protein